MGGAILSTSFFTLKLAIEVLKGKLNKTINDIGGNPLLRVTFPRGVCVPSYRKKKPAEMVKFTYIFPNKIT